MSNNTIGNATDGNFNKLVDIVAHLRSDEGCSWDREQTFRTMIECVREETEEVVEAIRREDSENLEEELGDLLLQPVFLAQIAAEKDLFDIEDVLKRLNEKLIRRHPHVFGEENAESPEESIEHWETTKKNE